jgi:hypothetical protein
MCLLPGGRSNKVEITNNQNDVVETDAQHVLICVAFPKNGITNNQNDVVETDAQHVLICVAFPKNGITMSDGVALSKNYKKAGYVPRSPTSTTSTLGQELLQSC